MSDDAKMLWFDHTQARMQIGSMRMSKHFTNYMATCALCIFFNLYLDNRINSPFFLVRDDCGPERKETNVSNKKLQKTDRRRQTQAHLFFLSSIFSFSFSTDD